MASEADSYAINRLYDHAFMDVWSYIGEVLYCCHDERSAKVSFVSGTAVKQN